MKRSDTTIRNAKPAGKPLRLFRRLKAWRRIFTRYDKLDSMFAAFITCVLIAEGLR